MIWFIPDDERDENRNRIDHLLKEKKPELYVRIKEGAMERFRRHERELTGLFSNRHDPKANIS